VRAREISRRAGDWYRLPAFAIAVVFVVAALAAVALARSASIVADFLSFWAAGHLTAGGQPAWAYDLARHHALEAQAVSRVGILPFPYPPPFLLVVVPFGLLPFWIALAAWIAISAALYLIASRRIVEPRFALAQAAAAANFVTGQNGFLTSAIFIGGVSLLATRPFAAGAILGLLCFKPQLAILLPVALIAGREWRAIAGGVASTIALLIAALLLFGMDSYRGFLALLPHFSQWLSAGRWPWGEMASTFALLRALGVPTAAALLIHGAIALGAAVLTARAWALKLETRVPILAAATLLIPPYLFTYDALLLTIPLGWLLRQRAVGAGFLLVWIFSLLPVVAYFTPFPNTIPLAAVVSLWALHRADALNALERPLPRAGESREVPTQAVATD
jgi:glycosyl transferase family 87